MSAVAVPAREAVGVARAWLPFGYRAQWDGDLLVLRRPDGSSVAAFSERGADPFEVECAAWEDAD